MSLRKVDPTRLREMRAQGKSISDMAKAMDCAEVTINKWLRIMGLTVPNNLGTIEQQKRHELNVERWRRMGYFG